jgi:hypothetical protein
MTLCGDSQSSAEYEGTYFVNRSSLVISLVLIALPVGSIRGAGGQIRD